MLTFKTLKLKNKQFPTELQGSYYMGHIEELFDTLVKVFGKPEGAVDNKSKVNWLLLFNDPKIDYEIPVSIYDYKSEVPAKKNKVWNVGGKHNAARLCVFAAITDWKKRNLKGGELY
jgi:hypothetical protein